MRNTVLARPNLKLILLGALLLALGYDFLSNGKTQASVFRPANPRIAAVLTDDELASLIREAEAKPSASAFAQISEAYYKRGDIRKARHFLRRADLYERIENSD